MLLNLSDKSHIVLENCRLLTALIKCNQATSLEMMKATEVKIIPMYWNEVQNQLITFISAYMQPIHDRCMVSLWTSLRYSGIIITFIILFYDTFSVIFINFLQYSHHKSDTCNLWSLSNVMLLTENSVIQVLVI